MAELLTILTQGFGVTEVLLRHLLHAGQVLADFGTGGGLLVGGGGNQLVHLGDGTDVLRHRAQQFSRDLAVLHTTAHAVAALLHGLGGLTAALLQAADDLLDFRRGGGRFLRQIAHLISHHGKATALIAGAGRFNRGVQRQQVGLLGDRADHLQHLADLFGLVGQRLHFRFGQVDLFSQLADFTAHMVDRAAAFNGLLVSGLRRRCRAIGMPGDLINGTAHLPHGRTHVTDFALLTVRAGAEVAGGLHQAGPHLLQALGVADHFADQLIEGVEKTVKALADLACCGAAVAQVNLVITFRQFAGRLHQR